nr:MAG: hypothetical protein DIU56_17590 [Pseudomonadota bacterium]
MVAKAKFRLEGENATSAAFAQALRGAQDTAHRMQGIFRAAFAGLSIAGISAAVKQTLDLGDQLNKARIRAGMSAEAFTQLAYAARTAGVETSSFSTALRTMQSVQVQAITGGKEQKLAFDALGISLEKFRRLQPDKQFELLADRISRLEDPAERARAAMVLFGRSGAELLPLMEQGAEGIRKAREEAEKVGQSFSAEQLERLGKANDAVSRLGESFSALAVTLTAKVAPAFTRFFDDLAGVTSQQTVLDDKIRNLESRLRAGSFTPQARAELERELQILRNQRGAMEYARWMEEQVRAGETGTVRVPGFKAAADAMDAAAQSDKTIREAIERYRARELRERERLLREARPRIIDAEILEQERGDFVDALGGLEDDTRETLERMNEMWRKAAGEWSVFADEAARNIQSAFADFLFDPFEGGVKGMLKSFTDTLRRMAAEAASAKILDAIFGRKGEGGLSGFLGNIIGGLFGGKRAEGGPVDAGRAYLVGERGPELLLPRSAGTIVPNHALRAGPVVNITTHIDARHATSDFIRAMPEILRQNNAELEARIVDRIRRGFYDLSPA